MKNSIEDVLNFISVKTRRHETSFLFSSAAIDIFQSMYIALDEEIARELVTRVPNRDSSPVLTIEAVDRTITQAKQQVLCEQFLSENYPGLEIKNKITSFRNNNTEIQIILRSVRL